jgi:hypothetical protein
LSGENYNKLKVGGQKMKNVLKVVIALFVTIIIVGCHSIYHVKDIKSAGDGKIQVEKCEYYINGFWGTGGYQNCNVETITVVKEAK